MSSIKYPILNPAQRKIFKKFIKYGIGGGTAAVLDLVLLYVFTDIFHIYYIYSAILSFCLVFFIGFLFQKYIAFENKDKKHLKQGLFFLFFQLVGMGINILLLWIFVSYFGFYYLFVAVVNKIVIFFWNFTMNYFYTFK